RGLSERSVDALYDAFAKRGIVYTNAYRGIRRAEADAKGALVTIEATGDAALLDCCLQSIGLCPAIDAETPYLPVAVERFWWSGGVTKLRARVVWRAQTGPLLTMDVSLYDEGDRLIGEVSGLSAQKVEKHRLTATVDDWFYEEHWRSAELEGN